MRADRLVSLVLLLRQRGRLTAAELATALEVSPRTVLRDIEALSAAGVPVYAERGRHGGFALLPGFRTELAGLRADEALALVIAASRRGAQVFGLGSALASAVLKVLDALPDGQRTAAAGAAERLLADPDVDLLSRARAPEDVPEPVVSVVRRGVLAGRRLRLHYSAAGQTPAWRTVDPVGLVTVRDSAYLLATRDGQDRTYRLSRVLAVEELDEPARRPDRVDLLRTWHQRSRQFREGGDRLLVRLRLHPSRREELVATALAVHEEGRGEDGWLLLAAAFQDARHARWALWQLAGGAEALSPPDLRADLQARATAFAARHARLEGV